MTLDIYDRIPCPAGCEAGYVEDEDGSPVECPVCEGTNLHPEVLAGCQHEHRAVITFGEEGGGFRPPSA